MFKSYWLPTSHIYICNLNCEDYPQGVDVAVYFLTQAKAGICQHFATAATLLYRSYGIPARYTVGFVDKVMVGEKTELNGKDAHAWVEIYVDGLGWVPIEVTGSTTFGNATAELYIKACNATKYFDGKDFTGYNLEQYRIMQGFLRRGHRLDITFESGIYAKWPGTYQNRITRCKVYDRDGNDVTDQYSIYLEDGELNILHRPITIATGSASKYYDGTALQCREYWIQEGSLPQGHVLNLQFKASVTDVRKIVNYPASYEILDEYGTDVSKFYDITWIYGYLEVLPAESELP